MGDPNPAKERQLAVRIASTANVSEKEALRIWIERLLEVKSSNLSAAQKAKQAISVTTASSVVLPTVKIIARETKRLAWDNRGLQGRLGIGGAAVGLALFGGQGAGIAALGTAIGVPLWVVFGAGAAFLGVLYEELTRTNPDAKTSCQVFGPEREQEHLRVITVHSSARRNAAPLDSDGRNQETRRIMDHSKCIVLKAGLSEQPEPQIISIEQFFDGNDDLGSIGCNLVEHPGLDVFRNILTGLLQRPDVQAVYAQISELDPGDDCWPFTDTILVAGTIPTEDLRATVSALEPDEIGTAEEFGVSPSIATKHSSPVLAIWWD